jgi:hypothetical protein
MRSRKRIFIFMRKEANKSNTICEAVVLVLLMEGIYQVRLWDGLRWHNIYTKP